MAISTMTAEIGDSTWVTRGATWGRVATLEQVIEMVADSERWIVE